jgi:hypothetical protein
LVEEGFVVPLVGVGDGLLGAGVFGAAGVSAAAGVVITVAHSKAPAKAAAVKVEAIFLTTDLPISLNTDDNAGWHQPDLPLWSVLIECGHRHYSLRPFCCRSALDQLNPAILRPAF